MAGDWIKMRAELFTHPRFLSLYSALLCDDEHGLTIKACGSDALDIGVLPPRNESVTERALLLVTEDALRDVTMCALLRVWCNVNAHCKVRETDAIMHPTALVDLDVLSGISGFGEAMSSVGWVVEEDCNSLVFPNFLEFNEPACLRRAPLTNAERQRLYRERRTTNKGGVTKVTKSNGREEKRREEKSINPSTNVEGSSELASPASEPPILTFPCVGKGPKSWALTATKIAEYQASFPGVDVLAQCRAARQWCIDNPAKRKTAVGMPTFLNRWLTKQQNSSGHRNGEAAQVRPLLEF